MASLISLSWWAPRDVPHEIVIGELTGYRCWSVTWVRSLGIRLKSVGFGQYIWRTGPNVAAGPFGLPVNNPYGFYAFKTKAELDSAFNRFLLNVLHVVYLGVVIGNIVTEPWFFSAFVVFGYFIVFILRFTLGTVFPVAGEIEMWGDVRVHRRGYRSEYAEVTRIYWGVEPLMWPVIAYLKWVYLRGNDGHIARVQASDGGTDQTSGDSA